MNVYYLYLSISLVCRVVLKLFRAHLYFINLSICFSQSEQSLVSYMANISDLDLD